VWWICDAENAYPLKGILYTGKTGNVREMNQGERVVKELAISYKGSGRNISMDNFFTSLPLAKHLKPYIPQAFAPSKTREEFSSVFGFHEKIESLCSYVPKKNKAVIMLSNIHTEAVANDAKKKPEVILFYNKYKVGTIDQMLGRYTTH